jgi:hypothetical protein
MTYPCEPGLHLEDENRSGEGPRWWRLVAVFMALACLVTSPWVSVTVAQTAEASLSGVVADESGAAIPNVTLTLLSVDKGLQRQATSNAQGAFTFPLVDPGRYKLTASRQGFASVEIPDVVLNVGSQVALQIKMKIGAVEQKVVVEGGAPLINTQDASVSTVVDRQFVENLPLNGRSFQSLIEITPGVVITPAIAGNEGQFSVNGQRTDTNYFMVDGVSANVATSGSFGTLNRAGTGALPGFSVLGGTNNLVSVDAMQEFRIQTSSFAPEYGHSPGAQISILTRSGTNQFHGTMFDYFRNDAMDANDWFDSALSLPKPAERQNDFGGVFGGPIIKEKTFFFFSYEGLRLRLPNTAQTDVFSLSARQAASPAIAQYMNAFPIPNGPELLNPDGTPSGIAPFNASYSDRSSLDAYSIRVDHSINSKLSVFGRFNDSPSTLYDRSGQCCSVNSVFFNRVGTITLTAGSTWTVTPELSNEIRFNFTRNLGTASQSLDNFGGAVVPPDSVLFPAPLNPSAGAVVAFGVFQGLRLIYDTGKDIVTSTRQYNIVDNVSFQKGPHALKFGADYRLIEPIFSPYNGLSQAFSLNVAQLLTGQLYELLAAQGLGGTFYFHNFGLFAQDTWKVTPRLTLTYGVRWELNPAPSASKTLLAVNEVSDPSTIGLAPTGAPLWHTTYNNFAPRFGAAYQLRQKSGHEIVLRGGFGVFYDLGSQAAGGAIDTFVYPFGALTYSFAGTFPLTVPEATPPAITAAPPISGLTAFDPNLKVPYTLQWNFAVEQSLGTNQKLSVTYVGSAGERLEASQYYFAPTATFSGLTVVSNLANSNYNSLQAQFQRRLSHGLQSMVSYTWSHSIDDASASFASASSDLLSPGANNRGSSDFDIRNTLSAALTYDAPTPDVSPMLKAVLRGWSMDNIVQARSAPPVDVSATPVQVNPNQEYEVRPDVVSGQPLYLYGAACAAQYGGQPCPGGKGLNYSAFTNPPIDPVTGLPLRNGDLGRNALRGFGATQWDFAFRRLFPIHESMNLQFKAELFNILNHPNFGPPTSTLSVPPAQFGVATQMLGRSLGQGYGTGFSPLYQIGGPRSIQLALKLQF